MASGSVRSIRATRAAGFVDTATHGDISLRVDGCTTLDGRRREAVIRLGRPLVFTLLFLLFNFAYVLSPYWNLAPHAGLRIFLLALSVLIGLFWAFQSAAPLFVAVSRSQAWRLFGAFLILTALNARALTAGVPWRGDEDHHLLTTRSVIDVLLTHPGATALLTLLLGVLVFAAWRLNSLRAVAALCLFLCIIESAWILHTDPSPSDMRRYPLFSRWFAAAPIVFMGIFRDVHLPFTGSLDEALYRVVPFAAAVLLVWITASRATAASSVGQAVCMTVLGTVPLIHWYSSLLYLELPAVILMTVVCFSAHALLTSDTDAVRQSPAWLALLSIGFIKETTAPFLVTFVVFRLLARLRTLRQAARPSRSLVGEGMVDFCVLVPIVCWLGYRFAYQSFRQGPSEFGNILRPDLYFVILRSYLAQFGPLLAVSIVGAAVMLRQERFLEVGFFTGAFFADAVMHLIDSPVWIGHSRFNLFLLPMLLVTAAQAVRALNRRFSKVAALVSCLWLVVNVIISPVNFDGSKRPRWGDYVYDTSEHSYPYRSAIRWLNENSHGRRVLATGLYYSYQFKFYAAPTTLIDELPTAEPAALTPAVQNDAAEVAAALKAAQEKSYDFVLHRLSGLSVPSVPDSRGYVQRQVFRNAAHALVVYERRAER